MARGDCQCLGIDSRKMFSSMVRPKTFLLLMAMVATKNWEAYVIDVVTDFLHVILAMEPTLYFRPP